MSPGVKPLTGTKICVTCSEMGRRMVEMSLNRRLAHHWKRLVQRGDHDPVDRADESGAG